MRFFILIALLSFLSCESAVTQEEGNSVPKVVKEAFQAKYPDEKKEDWEIDRNGNWEAKFKEDGEHYKADFTPDGKWIETECSIKKKELPKAVEKSVKNQFDDYEIVEIEKTDHHSKGLFYDVEFKKDGKKFDVEFAKDGRVIGREE